MNPAPLATPAELHAHLQRTIAPDVAALALAGGSGAVRSYCGWNISREATTFVTEGAGSRILTMPTLRLLSVAEIRIGGLALDPAAPQPFVHLRGQLVWTSNWPTDVVIEVDAEHGYDDAPDVVRLVALSLAARIVNNPDNARTLSVGTVSRTYAPELAELDMRLLDPYRLE